MLTSVREETVLPPKDLEALTAMEELLGSGGSFDLVAESGKQVRLPGELVTMLTTVVSAMRRGQAVTVAPLAMRLTTQQAADLLGISRPTLVKLLESNRIPYETPNRHRRIRLVDLLTYQAAREAEQQDALRQLSQDSQDMGLYDRPGEDYEAALDEARLKFG